MPSRVITAPSRIVRHTPPLHRKVLNLARSALTIAHATTHGTPLLVPAVVMAARLEACLACPAGHWHPEGNAGLGECTHPRCGCTALKLNFAALACPLDPPEWREWAPDSAPDEEAAR